MEQMTADKPATFNSHYLEHLSKLAQEAADRYKGVPAFSIMIGMALSMHVMMLVFVYFLILPEDVPLSKQVHLAFGVDAKQRTRQVEETPKDPVTQSIDNMLNPNHPKPVTPSKKQPKPAPATAIISPPKSTSAARQVNRPVNRYTSPSRAKPIPQRRAGTLSSSITRRPPGRQSGASSASSAQIQEMITKYEQLLSGWINSHRLNQGFSLPKGLQGRTVVRIRINRRGVVMMQSIETSSGYQELDQASLNAVKRASPVPTVPDQYPGGGQLEFLIPINITVR